MPGISTAPIFRASRLHWTTTRLHPTSLLSPLLDFQTDEGVHCMASMMCMASRRFGAGLRHASDMMQRCLQRISFVFSLSILGQLSRPCWTFEPISSIISERAPSPQLSSSFTLLSTRMLLAIHYVSTNSVLAEKSALIHLPTSCN